MTALMRRLAGFSKRNPSFRVTEIVCDWNSGAPEYQHCGTGVTNYNAASARTSAREQGWRVNVPNPLPNSRTRKDFCPLHKNGADR